MKSNNPKRSINFYTSLAASALAFATAFNTTAFAAELPTGPNHPGSKVYASTFTEQNLKCSGRSVAAFIPNPNIGVVISFGHGQALDLKHYRKTFEHLAKKGIGILFPTYDTGFFDQDWPRMAKDFVQLTECAKNQIPSLSTTKVIYSGHSKGAYVASMALGLAPELGAKPQAAVLLEPAGSDASTLKKISADVTLTVVFSDSDTVVSRKFSDEIFAQAATPYRQFIFLKSYLSAKADHMWPLTSGTMFGGGDEGPLHYYGSWKWLTAAAWDLAQGDNRTNEYVYGSLASDKGDGSSDEVQRTW